MTMIYNLQWSSYPLLGGWPRAGMWRHTSGSLPWLLRVFMSYSVSPWSFLVKLLSTRTFHVTSTSTSGLSTGTVRDEQSLMLSPLCMALHEGVAPTHPSSCTAQNSTGRTWDLQDWRSV